MKDYYKIGEISKIYGIGRDSLMYYEDIGILKPFRDKNRYRMYKLSDIWRLNLIKELRSLNFPMKKIKEYLDDRNIESTKEILNRYLRLVTYPIEEKLKDNITFINNKTNTKNIDSLPSRGPNLTCLPDSLQFVTCIQIGAATINFLLLFQLN